VNRINRNAFLSAHFLKCPLIRTRHNCVFKLYLNSTNELHKVQDNWQKSSSYNREKETLFNIVYLVIIRTLFVLIIKYAGSEHREEEQDFRICNDVCVSTMKNSLCCRTISFGATF